MDGLARGFRAGKATLYSRYGSKAGLLLAAMERAVPVSLANLKSVDADLSRSPREVLREFGARLQRNANDPSMRALWNAVIQARGDSDSIEPAIADGKKRALSPLKDYFDRLGKAGIMRVADPARTAVAFAELASGGLNAFMHSPIAEPDRAAHLDFALVLFLNGVTPRDAAI